MSAHVVENPKLRSITAEKSGLANVRASTVKRIYFLWAIFLKVKCGFIFNPQPVGYRKVRSRTAADAFDILATNERQELCPLTEKELESVRKSRQVSYPGCPVRQLLRGSAEDKVGRFLKGLSHEIFRPVFWPVWIEIGLNMNPFWFLSFKEAPFI
jgi:hypothetical protein